MTLKESINVRGLPTTVGLPQWREMAVEFDAPATQRVQAAGAVLLGKTNVPPRLADWQADNAVYGRSDNPWDRTRTPGGSTSGRAAALAAGLTALEGGMGSVSSTGPRIAPSSGSGTCSWRPSP